MVPLPEGKKRAVANLLFMLEAIKFGTFKLKLHEKQPDAPLSPIYLNLRTARHPKNPGPVTDEVMGLIGSLFAEMEGIEAECFTDLPDAGEPFGDQWERATSGLEPPPRRLKLYKKQLADGRRQIDSVVHGSFSPGERCIVVDELITQADSKLEGIRALESQGLIVHDVVVAVDRQQGGREQLAAAGYTLHSLFTLRDLLDHYVARNYIDADKAHEVRQYISANRL